MKDPILEELHATRERLLLESGGTLAGLVARLQQEQAVSGRALWVPRRSRVESEVSVQPPPESASNPATR